MALILQKAWQAYKIVFEELPDPRTKDLPFIAKPYQGIALLTLYLMFVLKWGPKWMKNRQPFNLDKILIVYNALQIVACAYLLHKGIVLAWGWDYKWLCEPVNRSYETKPMNITRLCYYYFLLKLVDLLDTVFFVLRKKFNQISFLHIYHHTGMVLLIWGAATYLPGGHGTSVGIINTFVHIVMYSYYLLTVAMPSIKHSLWIKKHVTQLQILQFFLCVVHIGILVFKQECEYPRWVAAVFLPQNLFMLVLFIDFYIKTYILKPKQAIKENGSEPNNNNLEKNGTKTILNGNNGHNNNNFDALKSKKIV